MITLKNINRVAALFLTVFAYQVTEAAVTEIILDPTTRWSSGSGEMVLELRGDFLPDYGLEILVDGKVLTRRAGKTYPIQTPGALEIYAPFGRFQGFIGGRQELQTDIVLRHAGNEVSLERMVVTPVEGDKLAALEMRDLQGNLLLVLTHLHIEADHATGQLTIHNADVKATKTLAELLRLPVLAETPIGLAWLDLNLNIPQGAKTSGDGGDLINSGLSCDGRPLWPQGGTEVDVTLIDMGVVAYQGRDTSDPGDVRVKVAPAARLKNESAGDVPWIPKFSSLGSYPHTPPDQHPFLVWNMYRISNGRIEQLAASGVKHAFFTINQSCSLSCNYMNGNILAPGCEDVYSTGNNDSSNNLGPRYDITPSLGLFDSCDSFFSPGAGCSQTNSSSNFENRLMVPEDELSTAGAEYYLDSWYVIQFDTNIWNSMGYHQINPQPAGGSGWSFSLITTFEQGPTISEWVAEDTVDPMQGHVVVQVPNSNPPAPYPDHMPQGHLRVLVKVTEVSANRWRYNYAVQNFDFDRSFDRFEIPLADTAQVFETFFGDVEVDGENGADWTVDHSDGVLSFQAPAGNELTWFSLFNFEVETDAAPQEAGQIKLGVGEGGTPLELAVDIVAPGSLEDLFKSGFEVGGTAQ